MIHILYGLLIGFIFLMFYLFYIFNEKIYNDLKKESVRDKKYIQELENKLMKFLENT